MQSLLPVVVFLLRVSVGMSLELTNSYAQQSGHSRLRFRNALRIHYISGFE
jgi:hypothetical protein